MQSLELLVLVSFSLLIVFAAVPYIWQLASATMAQWEARQFVTFMSTLADSMESDFGMAGVVRSYYMPSLVFGAFSVRSYPMYLVCQSTGAGVTFNSLYIWYNSSYILGGAKPVRGERSVAPAPLGQPLVAVNATGMGYVLFTGPVYVPGQSTVLYVVNATVSPLSGYAITYRVVGVSDGYSNDRLRIDCPGGVFKVGLVGGPSYLYNLGTTVVVVSTQVAVS
ncbi:hypothetical protein [Pyrobaculum neutrophilum]|uniref:Uncharacterized protein n=1 Tax=Pyrobaculum neutrophilum (strain DSM 2338 / JCM 9278 / NBRC 100436 / V24Sta) TaxID=444157 RepID=B1YAA0_PYRNV|nr:hypothetical protein [Pyrobaculum neutrophilum]ACB39074.1 hypothetical protein Tneu_0116 [Pyrobaculum neutrophilum V24Sta]